MTYISRCMMEFHLQISLNSAVSFVSAEFVFSSGAGLWSRQELVLGEEVLWGGLSGERQLSEILLYQGVRYESKS